MAPVEGEEAEARVDADGWEEQWRGAGMEFREVTSVDS